MTPMGVLNAGLKGPQSFMNYMVNNSARGMAVDDMWRQADMMISLPFLVRGNAEGAQRAHEFIFQLAHAGTNMAMMQGYSALRMGDYQGAAQLLAKAYSFFPDGGSMVLQPTSNGLFAQRYNSDTGQPMGTPFQVTPQGVAGMLNQTTDPQQWAKTLTEEQTAVANATHKSVLDEYYQNRPQTQKDIAQMHIDAAEANRQAAENSAMQRLQYTQDQENQRAAATNARLNQVHADTLNQQQAVKDQAVNGFLNQYYPSFASGQGGVDANTAQEAGYAAGLFRNNMPAPQSKYIAQELMKPDGQYQLRPMADGQNTAVVQRNNPNQPIAIFSAGTVAHLGYPRPAAPQGAAPPPIGGQLPQAPPPLTTGANPATSM